MNVLARLRQAVLAYPPLLWRIGLVLFINVTGFSFIWPITTIYIHDQLGRPVTVAGLVLLLYSGASSLGQLAGGALYDRVGARRVMTAGLLVAGAAIALPGLSANWVLYVSAMILFGFSQSLFFPAANALAATSWPEGGREAFNFIYVVHNAGVAAGTALGGLVASRSFTEVFLTTAAISLAAGVLVWLTVRDPARGVSKRGGSGRTEGAGAAAVPWEPVLALLVSAVTLWVVYVQWTGTIAVYMQSIGIPLPAYSLLWTLNGLLIVLGQPLVAWVVRLARSLTTQLILGTALFGISFSLLLLSSRYAVFVAAMVVLTLGEMLVWPGLPAAIDRLAPPARRGSLLGLLGGATSAGRMFGPLVGGFVYDRYGHAVLLNALPWLLLPSFAAFLVYAWSSRRAGRSDQGLTQQPASD